MLNMNVMAQWLSATLVTFKTWVQVPGLQQFPIIFPLIITCRHKIRIHHTSSNQATHASNMIRSMANIQGAAYSRSTRWHMIRKVKRIPSQMGLIF